METNTQKFMPFQLTIIDVVEMLNAAMLAITGYNIGNSAVWFAISTGATYAIGKKFVEIGKAKMAKNEVRTDPAPV